MKNLEKISKILLLIILSCGKVYALPQDWPCEKIVLTKSNNITNSGNIFQGSNGDYKIIIEEFNDKADYPTIYNCGNSGCMGTMINLKTGQHEQMRFDCLFNKDANTLTCNRISGDEYILKHIAKNEYRVELCEKFYKYIFINECSGCTCILHDSRGEKYSNNYEMNCTRENKKYLHCYQKEAYNWAHKYENGINDFEKCIGLSLK